MSTIYAKYISAHSDLIEALKVEIKEKEANLYDLQIELQNAEAELCSFEDLYPSHPMNTKFKWVLNEETYRVAILTKEGFLQVKTVNEGVVENREGFRLEFLKKNLFENEGEWRMSLPQGGKIIVTPPQLSDAVLKELCMTPLRNTSDAVKLMELELRFKGGVFVLTTPWNQIDIEYLYIPDDSSSYKHRIMNSKTKSSYCSFKQMGADENPRLMVVYEGLYIDLSHLF